MNSIFIPVISTARQVESEPDARQGAPEESRRSKGTGPRTARSTRNSKAMKKRDTRFQPGASGSEATKWRPGQSGNPSGRSKLRINFERVFTDALLNIGSPDEAAQLLWSAARKGEPWAIQNLCQRFSPETRSLRIIQEDDHEQIDYSKLTDEQIDQLDAILQQAAVEPPASEGGEGSPQSV